MTHSILSRLGLSGKSGRITLLMLVIMLLIAILLHFLTLVLRDHGPSFGYFALNGNGAIIVLVLDLIALLICEVICVRNRAWLAVGLLPFVWFVGRFILFGSA